MNLVRHDLLFEDHDAQGSVYAPPLNQPPISGPASSSLLEMDIDEMRSHMEKSSSEAIIIFLERICATTAYQMQGSGDFHLQLFSKNGVYSVLKEQLSLF